MSLNDLYHYVGSDLLTSATGDLQQTNPTQRGQQRILRRLLTNQGDYIFHPDYGAGLPAQVGLTTDIAKITALIRGQILLEDAVGKKPEPTITVKPISSGISVSIKYQDATTGQPSSLSFNVSK